MVVTPVTGSSLRLRSNTMKWRSRSSSVVGSSMPVISVSNWPTRCEASTLPSAVFQLMKRLKVRTHRACAGLQAIADHHETRCR
jgi:hypothetical protein